MDLYCDFPGLVYAYLCGHLPGDKVEVTTTGGNPKWSFFPKSSNVGVSVDTSGGENQIALARTTGELLVSLILSDDHNG